LPDGAIGQLTYPRKNNSYDKKTRKQNGRHYRRQSGAAVRRDVQEKLTRKYLNEYNIRNTNNWQVDDSGGKDW
jgi:hypothetical protein